MEEKYSNPNMHGSDEEEEEEALSFCDLPMYGSDEAEWEKFSKEDQSLSSSSLSSSSSSSEHDLFEFFCEEWRSGSSSSNLLYPPVHENIVFCGKLIPTKEPVSNSKIITAHKRKDKEETPSKRGISLWKSKGLRQRSLSRDKKANERDLSSSKSLSLPASEKYGNKVERGGGKYGFPVPRVTSPPAKARWSLMMFGLARLPAEMELSDIRSRQSRRQSPSSSALVRQRGGGGGDEKVSGGGKGWWGVIRALGCGGGSIYANAVAVV